MQYNSYGADYTNTPNQTKPTTLHLARRITHKECASGLIRVYISRFIVSRRLCKLIRRRVINNSGIARDLCLLLSGASIITELRARTALCVESPTNYDGQRNDARFRLNR